ncbi:ribonuclease p subunit [Nosema bombycis CQ1]|uniref:Ribonuclease p subunit n=1 Tax=Nosema bombycis (strain CQ1 / CVCC 102059) TaxID=578461 RepID=R0KTA2_NOSB1|nr:ribonuclease p subunit [Nosema bombycis CQ1]|eukprot:EOB13452.1 ribonuclease p subunit [Nosema bombycis CQ1]
MKNNQISFSDWYKSNSSPLGLFSTSKRSYTPSISHNLKVPRSSDIPTYQQFLEIHKLFLEYVPNSNDPNAFMQILFKIELTGAKVFIDKKKFIIVEERKNSIKTISEDGRLRTHIKGGLKMIFEHNKVKYCIFGKYLKLNRFFKK